MSEVLANIKSRRSIRSFKEDQVSEEHLNEILTAGLYAPSAKNSQAWQFTVVQDAQKLEKLSKEVGIAIGNPDYHRFYNAPTLILVSFPRGYAFGAADGGTALQNIFLEANALGVGSVWINQLVGNSDVSGIREVLTSFDIPKDHIVLGSAAIGYPLELPKNSKEINGIVKFV